MAKPNLRDWLASRTVRVHALFMALYPTIALVSVEQWQAMGVASTWAERLPVLIGVLHGLAGGYMRKITDTPLSGRAE